MTNRIYGATLALTLTFSLAGSQPAFCASDWIDGDAEEIPLNKPRPRRTVAPEPDENYIDETQSARPARLNRLNRMNSINNPDADAEDAAADGGNSGERTESESSGGGRPRRSGEDEELTPPAPVLKLDGSGRITGGVSSATVRTSARQRSNRGLDNMAVQFLQQAPFLQQAKTATVQPALFKNWLEKSHPGQSAKFGKTTIVELKGKWDDCGHVIRSFGLPFTKITPNNLATTDLSGTKILVVNCGSVLNEAALKKLQEFVDKGGYLLSTDWALDSCLQKAFPGYVEWNSGYTSAGVVDAVVVDRDPILLAGVPRVAHWQLEDKSQIVRVIRGRSVQVLARSRMLMHDDQDQLGILALTFPYGDGRILHLVGHFDNNANLSFNTALPDPAPIIGIGLRQAIAANFIMAALEGDVTTAKNDEQR